MSLRLRDDPDTLAVLLQQAADAVGVRPSFVEKDFWAIEVLRAAQVNRVIPLRNGTSTGEVVFLFKGGTSLSRAFGLVERFSEDVDLLAVSPDDTSRNARHTVLKQVDAGVSSHLGVAGEVVQGSSDTGVKRYTTYAYSAVHADSDLTEGVLLELGSRGGTHPSVEVPIRSMLADVAMEKLGFAADEWAEFASFRAHVLAPERTLLEKLSALHTAASTGDRRLAGMGRHLYDIYQLLGSDRVLDALRTLGSAGVANLAADVHAHSLEAGFASVERPRSGYAASPAFVTGNAGVAAAYARVGVLVYGDLPALSDVLARVQENKGLL
jgi:hypothetical protein